MTVFHGNEYFIEFTVAPASSSSLIFPTEAGKIQPDNGPDSTGRNETGTYKGG